MICPFCGSTIADDSKICPKCGERILENLQNTNADADDMIRIKECDLFIYVGGESEHWVEDALPGGTNPDRVVINLLETLGDAAKAEEHVEGMEANEEEE